MPEYPFFVMSPLEAARLREVTAPLPSRLDPIRIVNGPYKNKYALPERVARDPAHAAHLDAFAVMETVVLDTDVAFPSEEE